MENHEDYKYLLSLVQEFEQQGLKYIGIDNSLTKDYNELKKQLDEHFEQCTKALMERKTALMLEIQNSIEAKKKKYQTGKANLEKSIQGCKEILKTGSLLFSTSESTASHIWKSASTLPIPQVTEPIEKLDVMLPISLIQVISQHGSVSFSEGEVAPFMRTDYNEPSPTNNITNVTPRPSKKQRPDSPLHPIELKTENKGSANQAEVVTTLAGSRPGNRDGVGDQVEMRNPLGICINPLDNFIYIADNRNFLIRRINRNGEMSIFGDLEKSFEVKHPHGLAFDKTSQCFIYTEDLHHYIGKITLKGEVTKLAGTGWKGAKDGPAATATFDRPTGVAIDHNGVVYICDTNDHKIRKIVDGVVSTFVGGKSGYADGEAVNAQFSSPQGIFFDEVEQNLLVCDLDNQKLRKVTLSGVVSTVCEAAFPSCAVMTKARTIITTSAFNNTVAKITKEGDTFKTVVFGTGKRESIDGGPNECSFSQPIGLVFDESTHCCFIADFSGCKIRKLPIIE